MRRSSAGGFTFLELTITLAVAAALAAVAIPRAGKFIDQIEVRGAVTEIESMFSVARHVAIARGAQSVLDIDAPRGLLSIRVGAERITSRDIGPAHGVAISTNRTSMTYSPVGMGYGAANFTMVVSRRSAVDSIVISRLGRVRH